MRFLRPGRRGARSRAWLAAALLLGPAVSAGGAGEGLPGAAPPGEDPLRPGFRTHAVPTPGGSVDWTAGSIRAEGRGSATGSGARDRLMARRAALEAAKRNAIAISAGLRLDGSRTIAEVPDGMIRVEGRIRGFREVDESWNPDANPPEYRVEIEVPVWGASGIAEVFRLDQRARTRDLPRWELAPAVAESPAPGARSETPAREPQAAGVAEEIVVVDARGRDVEPSVFPSIVDTEGVVLQDASTVTGTDVPVARFVESDLPFEALISRLGIGRALVLPAAYRLQPQEQETGEAEPATRRRERRARPVRAVDASGDARTTLVVAAEDARTLAASAAGSEALRQGRVLIVTDAAAAGTEGRWRPRAAEPPWERRRGR